jgi:hypothetical protein
MFISLLSLCAVVVDDVEFEIRKNYKKFHNGKFLAFKTH